MTIFKGFVSAISLAILLTAAVRAEIGVSDKDILLGAGNAQSGQNAQGGKETDNGINALFNRINGSGGINGRKLRVVVCDDKYEPEQSIACFNTLSSQGVFGLIGVYGSVCAARYIAMCTNAKMPVVGFHNGTSFVTDPPKRYVFEVRAGYRDEMQQAVDRLWDDAGMRKFAVIYQNDAFGADCLDGVKRALEKRHAQVVAAASYTRNKTDVKDAVNEVKKEDPEVVFLGAVYKPCSEIVSLANSMHWHPVWVMNSGTSVDLFVKDAGPLADGSLFTEVVPSPSRTDLHLIEQYQKDLKASFPDEKPGFVSLRGYMDALVWVEGLKRAGKNPTREKFVNALESMHKLDVGLGKGMEISYSPTDHLGLHKVFIGTIKNGQPGDLTDWKTLKQK